MIEECTDGGRKAERLRDAKCCVQLNCEGEISSMMNFGEQGETGRILLSNGDEQQRLGEDTGPGDDDDVGGEVPDVVLRCTVDEKKAKRLGDDLTCVQLSCVKKVSSSANFGEHVLTGQETHGIENTAPSLSEVERTTNTVRPGKNNEELPIDILLEQRQNLETVGRLHEEYSRMIDSTGSARTPS